MWTDREKEREMTKLTVAFLNSANAHDNTRFNAVFPYVITQNSEAYVNLTTQNLYVSPNL